MDFAGGQSGRRNCNRAVNQHQNYFVVGVERDEVGSLTCFN
jgi:hypothetical protein